jgi:hypothetical protein
MSTQTPSHGNITGALTRETLGYIKTAHSDLLHRFVRSSPGQLRIEVHLFRSLLHDLAEWARGPDELQELAHTARWWESYWYEQEYADADLTDLTAEAESELARQRASFERRHIPLWAPTIDFAALTLEIKAKGTRHSELLRCFRRISELAGWDELLHIIRHSPPTMRVLLVNAINAAIRNSNPSQYTIPFLEFINVLSDSFGIRWTTDHSSISIDLLTSFGPETVRSLGPLPSNVRDWLTEQERSRDYDEQVRLVGLQDIETQKREIMDRLVA